MMATAVSFTFAFIIHALFAGSFVGGFLGRRSCESGDSGSGGSGGSGSSSSSSSRGTGGAVGPTDADDDDLRQTLLADGLNKDQSTSGPLG